MNKDENFDLEYDPKLCILSSSRDQIDLDRIKRLVQDSRYICLGCGRTAADQENLCSPEEL
jgi:hypothetical protein